ncbi:BQ5605_C003g02368 [Microbotryum silenes-dioicae]|uniref:BQ5605_C003g02368 protein n=1 Tax=Microbotryum silenes-dioicae TaxID=796604 RepID=A0A2X0M1D3_9BASI|nr:BQ5605_C003g02368 [Microbotryum silenes-dioicae]
MARSLSGSYTEGAIEGRRGRACASSIDDNDAARFRAESDEERPHVDFLPPTCSIHYCSQPIYPKYEQNTNSSGGRQMNDGNASMSGDTSSRDNVNNEGDITNKSFSSSDASSDQFSADGASSATSAGQSGTAGGIGSTGKYSDVQGGSKYDNEQTETYSTCDNSGEGRGGAYESRSGGRNQGDDYATMSGDTSSKPNVNNEFPSEDQDNANFKSSSSRTRESGNDYEGGGSYEGAKGYGQPRVEKDQATGDFQ